MDARRCRHCKRGNVNQPRGLCYTCYKQRDIRERYPSQSKFSPRLHDEDFNGGYAQPPEPTDAVPGSEAKQLELARRVRLRVSLWHRRDADHSGRCG